MDRRSTGEKCRTPIAHALSARGPPLRNRPGSWIWVFSCQSVLEADDRQVRPNRNRLQLRVLHMRPAEYPILRHASGGGLRSPVRDDVRIVIGPTGPGMARFSAISPSTMGPGGPCPAACASRMADTYCDPRAGRCASLAASCALNAWVSESIASDLKRFGSNSEWFGVNSARSCDCLQH